jgi:hypothetical protein
MAIDFSKLMKKKGMGAGPVAPPDLMAQPPAQLGGMGALMGGGPATPPPTAAPRRKGKARRGRGKGY